jgi:hypothetical protein
MVRILLKSSACNDKSFRDCGVSYSKLVIPVQAGIQKCFAEKLDARLREHDWKNSPPVQSIDSKSIYRRKEVYS